MLSDKLNYWADEIDYGSGKTAQRFLEGNAMLINYGTDCGDGGDCNGGGECRDDSGGNSSCGDDDPA